MTALWLPCGTEVITALDVDQAPVSGCQRIIGPLTAK
jgi:hypothetical protein